jgi:PKHD-type hydroxylase
MFLRISKLLAPDQIETIQDYLKDADFVDGNVTAGTQARRVKNNLQLSRDAADREEIDNIVGRDLRTNDLVQAYAFPRRIMRPLFNRYEPGMEYGAHTDDPIMDARGTAVRSDLSVTIFLNDPDSYDGGWLVIENVSSATRLKFPAGDAVIYPSNSLHHVAPVGRGERLVAVTWMQSYIRDPGRREILFDMDVVRRTLMKRPDSQKETDRLSKSYYNLIRTWADG